LLRLPEQFFRSRCFHPDTPPSGRRANGISFKDGELYPLPGRGVKGSIRLKTKRFSIRRKTIFWYDLTRPEAGVYI
jgi:hypothetical protein